MTYLCENFNMAKITFKNKAGKTEERELPEGEILFIALEERGTELRHGCLSGSCGTCKINVTADHDGLTEPGPIEKDTIDSIYKNLEEYMPVEEIKSLNLRLSCRAKIAGNLSFEPFEKPKQKLSEKETK